MKEKLVIYLAGHVPEYEYRTYCMENYGEEYELFDPISMVPEDQYYKIIVEDDKKAIRKSDILIAWIEKSSFGTGMEIPYAYDLDIPVLIVNPNGKFKDDTWLKYHSKKIFDSLDKCFSYIRETYVE